MKILIVDDDQYTRESLHRFLTYVLNEQCFPVTNASDAIELIQTDYFDLIITDYRMPGITGLELLKWIKENPSSSTSEVLMVSGLKNPSITVECIRAGALQFLAKPVKIEELADIIRQLKNKQPSEIPMSFSQVNEPEDRNDNSLALLSHVKEPLGFYSDVMKKVLDFIVTLRNERDVPVLIEGETGTGKEIIARYLREEGAKTPFVSINCSAISATLFESELFGYEEGSFTGAHRYGKPGKFEQAQHGILFLDEIGDLPLDLQPKLLRVLQEKEVSRIGSQKVIPLNVRIVCATNKNLNDEIKSGRFRSDLYYRLHTGYVYLPPLRQRTEDIEPLAMLFLKHYSQKRKKTFTTFHRTAMDNMIRYAWPGNIRELKNCIDRITLLFNEPLVKCVHLPFVSKEITEDLSSDDQINLHLKLHEDFRSLEDIEYHVIQQVLTHFNDNKTKTAEFLKISRNRLKRKI